MEEIQKINHWFAKISDEDLELNELEKDEIGRRMLSNIRASLPSAKKSTSRRLSGFLPLKIAASLLIATLFVYFLVDREGQVVESNDVTQMSSSTDVIKHSNTTNATLKIQLPDSSSVELKPNSEISYSKKWDDQKREVHLIGEAFFEVVKDSKRPFYVYGGEVITKVLGTSFSVKAAENAETIEVAVRTGKVSVYEGAHQTMSNLNGTDASGVILTPNEKVEYFVKDNHWVTSLVEEPKALPSSNKAVDLVFSDTPISEIIKSIEATYSIDVIMENDASYSCTFTGDVSMMELYDILDVICKSTGTNYEVKGTKILITGRGCE